MILLEGEAGGLNLGPLAPHDFVEVLAGLLVVFIVWFIFAKFVSPNFEKMYEQRSNEIEGGIMRAEQAQAEAEQLRKQYAAQMDAAKDEAAKLREEARAQAAALKAQLREEGVAEKNRLLEAAHAQIAAERDQAEHQLRSEIGGLATTLAGRIVGETLKGDQSKAVVDRFLEELDATPAGAAK